jgi:hypothetical protein
MKFFLFLLCALVVGPSLAQPAAEALVADSGSQQSQIAAERVRLEAGFKAEEAACYSRFFVNACLQEIRPRRAQAMAELRRQEIVLNDAERKARAADQLQKTEDKQSAERQQQRADQEQKARDDAAKRLERNDQRAQAQGKTDEQAGVNVTAAQARQKNSEAKAGEVLTRQEQAALKAEQAKTRADKAAQHQADRERRLKEKGPVTGKPLPALP